MGIDIFVFDFLMNFKDRRLGDSLCLGRQGLHIPRGTWAWDHAEETLTEHDPGRTLDELVSSDGYSEKFLRYLGADTITALDYSPFEGAEVVHDLNEPIPPTMRDRYDFIFDGGTLEHVYNFPVAIANVKTMLRVGGLFISVNGANNQLGHGLYQFSPELFWRVFAKETGFVVERMQLVPMTENCSPPPIDAPDPAGVRQTIHMPHCTYLMVAARRESAKIATGNVYQSDYAVAWRR
jgi:hypothetical protein